MKLRRFIWIALFAVAANPTQAQETIPVARIDSVFTEHNRSDRPGCTLAVFKNGEIAYANGYGMANLEYGIALRPTSVFHIASISKQFTAFAIVLRVLYTAFGEPDLTTQWSTLFAVLAVLTMTVGNLLALSQRNIKRMLGYSTVAHAGYLLVGLAAVAANAEEPGSIAGPQGVLFYLAAYAFTNLAVFMAIIAVTNRTGNDLISGFAGMARRAPLLSVLLAFGLLSLLGLPPTAGFMAKVFVFSAAVNSDLAWLALAGVINSVVSAYYYLRVIRTMFLDEPETPERVRADIPIWVATLAASAGVALFGVAPWSLLKFAEKAVIGVVS